MINEMASSNRTEITNHIVTYYESKLSKNISWIPRLDGLSFDVLDPQEMEQFERLFDELEARKVLKYMVGDTTLGINGFSMDIFQTSWELLKEYTIRVFVMNFMKT